MSLIFVIMLLGAVAGPLASSFYLKFNRNLSLVLIKAVPSSIEKEKILNLLIHNPQPTASQAQEVRLFLGRSYRYPALILAGLLFLAVWRFDPGIKFRNKHTMESLLKVSSKHFKCLKPIVKCGPITSQENFEGPWAIAESPLRFCLARGLLKGDNGQKLAIWDILDKNTALPICPPSDYGEFLGPYHLDTYALREVLAKQLGPVFRGEVRAMPSSHRSLAAAFLAHFLDDKQTAMAIFDRLSESWEPISSEPPKGALGLLRRVKGLDSSPADKFLDRLDRSPTTVKQLAALVGHHFYQNVWFMALLSLARTKGVLPSSLWIWLKPTDRTLFYALNQVGARVAWAEALGPWSHLAAEKNRGFCLPNPMVESAVEALTKSLAEDGWLATNSNAKDKNYFQESLQDSFQDSFNSENWAPKASQKNNPELNPDLKAELKDEFKIELESEPGQEFEHDSALESKLEFGFDPIDGTHLALVREDSGFCENSGLSEDSGQGLDSFKGTLATSPIDLSEFSPPKPTDLESEKLVRKTIKSRFKHN
jgi:hypothetical protein